jgi:hypothetical protein
MPKSTKLAGDPAISWLSFMTMYSAPLKVPEEEQDVKSFTLMTTLSSFNPRIGWSGHGPVKGMM